MLASITEPVRPFCLVLMLCGLTRCQRDCTYDMLFATPLVCRHPAFAQSAAAATAAPAAPAEPETPDTPTAAAARALAPLSGAPCLNRVRQPRAHAQEQAR
jgi:hypothetical protein